MWMSWRRGLRSLSGDQSWTVNHFELEALVVFCLLMGRYDLVRESLGAMSLLFSSFLRVYGIFSGNVHHSYIQFTSKSRAIISALSVLDHETRTQQSLHRSA
jgi:hypothetical protein